MTRSAPLNQRERLVVSLACAQPSARTRCARHVPTVFAAVLLCIGLAEPLPTLGQEVVVFTDGRSLVVTRHREEGAWTYLSVENGELAVPTSRISSIEREGVVSPRGPISPSPPPLPPRGTENASPQEVSPLPEAIGEAPGEALQEEVPPGGTEAEVSTGKRPVAAQSRGTFDPSRPQPAGDVRRAEGAQTLQPMGRGGRAPR